MIETERTVNADCGLGHSLFDASGATSGSRSGKTRIGEPASGGKNRRVASFVLAAVLVLAAVFPAPGYAAGREAVRAAADRAEAYLRAAVPAPVPGAVGGEWTVIGLARRGAAGAGTAFALYRQALIDELEATGGRLTSTKYSEYSRRILALNAIGSDPSSVGGRNFFPYLSDLSLVAKQGINGPAYALLALDSNGYPDPKPDPVQAGPLATREALLRWILDRELPGGGFALGGTAPDPDVTAIVLQALAPYRNRTDVKSAVQRALDALATLRTGSGGYRSYGEENLESLAQVILALTELGIDPETASPGSVAALLSYQLADGSFSHIKQEPSEWMPTEQALLALTALERFYAGAPSLFRMSDARDYKVRINGSRLFFDQAPVNREGRILVPLRAIFEALGAQVTWDPATSTAIGEWAGHRVELAVGSTRALRDGAVIELDVPATIVNGRTLVPVRFIAESLEADVRWNGDERTVEIRR